VSDVLDGLEAQAGDRFGALSATFDGWTRAHLDGIGLAPGWACWEVGAGGPAVPAWLADRVGTAGRVVATDLDISWMPAGAAFTAERRDVAADPPPDGLFDLVHARLVLTHVPRRDEALRRMAAALAPGGWLIVEDFDVSVQPRACPDAATPEEDRANRLREGFIELLVQGAVDLTFGRTLRRRLRGLGLVDVGAEAYAPLAVPATRRLEIANTLQARPGLEALGLGDELAAHLDALRAGRIDIATPPLVTAWGRQP
jgi:SAM-dependent methyltransferase